MRHGFTLMETLIVILIIGILSTLGVYGYGIMLERNRDSERVSNLKTIQNSLEQFYVDNRRYPSRDSTKGGGSIFNAKWNLSESFPSECPHHPDVSSNFLAPRYLTTIPEDPSHKAVFTTNCSVVQQDSFLYLPLTIDDFQATDNGNLAERKQAKKYYLLAKTERTNNQNLDDAIRARLRGFVSSVDINSYTYYLTNSKNN